jgi:hypothetical protein
MGHFAKVNNGFVQQVIVAEQDYIDTLPDASSWIQTSYNTYGGAHKNNGTPLRKNYAGIGFAYDQTKDAFIPPKPFNSWVLDEQTCLWNAPVAYPTDDKKYRWDEPTTSWTEIEMEQK